MSHLLKVFPRKERKTSFQFFFNKIFIFLTDTNKEKIVLTNVVYGVYIPHLEESLPR